MKVTEYCLFTSKNDFSNSGNLVFNLMVKGGLIRKLSSGIYIWLPNGFKIINNIINIVKLEMSKIGSLELLMPIINPVNIWFKSNRLCKYGKEIFTLYDRKNKLFILSPTHEEVITKLICEEKLFNLPKIFYQIQTKFRDEIRPCLGVNRSREFIMKDAYSFHKSKKCLDRIYYEMFNIYENIFKKICLNVYYKEANCGKIGGFISHEFHVLSKNGENKIYIDKKNLFNTYSVNIKNIDFSFFTKNFNLNKIDFIDIKNEFNLSFLFKNFFYVKTILIKFYFKKKKKIFFMLPYNRKLDLLKISKIFPLAKKIKVYSNNEIFIKFNINSFFLSPLGFNYKVIVDYSLISVKNFVIGSNKNNIFYKNVNWGKNICVSNFFDICKNISFNLKKKNKFIKNNVSVYSSIEIAHIFKLMDEYYKIFLNKNKINKYLYMGCYGIGISRIIYSLVDYYHNDNGIIWPNSIANFKLAIIPINMYKYNYLYNLSFDIYYYLLKNEINVILDDRKLYFGEMLTDLELIGVPNILIISKKVFSNGYIEFKDRLNNLTEFISLINIYNFLIKKFK